MPPDAPASPAQDRILHVLKTRGPQGAQALARRLGVTATAVRQHLERLLDEDLVAFEDVTGQVGRPKRVWRLAPRSDVRFPDSHAELAVGVIEAARAAFGPGGLDRLVAARTARQVEDYAERMPPSKASLERRVAALARIRAAEGYMAVSSRDPDGGFRLVEDHCPIRAAATSCLGLCAGELRLFEQVLGPGVAVERVEHVLAGGSRCAYRISPTGKAPARRT
jgi:predicted ArsR family transcriptional regulator